MYFNGRIPQQHCDNRDSRTQAMGEEDLESLLCMYRVFQRNVKNFKVYFVAVKVLMFPLLLFVHSGDLDK